MHTLCTGCRVFRLSRRPGCNIVARNQVRAFCLPLSRRCVRRMRNRKWPKATTGVPVRSAGSLHADDIRRTAPPIRPDRALNAPKYGRPVAALLHGSSPVRTATGAFDAALRGSVWLIAPSERNCGAGALGAAPVPHRAARRWLACGPHSVFRRGFVTLRCYSQRLTGFRKKSFRQHLLGH